MQKHCIMLSVFINKKKFPVKCEMKEKSLFQYPTRTKSNMSSFFFLNITLCLLVKWVAYAMSSHEQCILDLGLFIWIFRVLLEDFIWRQHRLQAEKPLEATVLKTENISYPKCTKPEHWNFQQTLIIFQRLTDSL